MFNEIKSSQAQVDKQFSSPAVKRKENRKQKKIENLLVDLEIFSFASNWIWRMYRAFVAPKFLGEYFRRLRQGFGVILTQFWRGFDNFTWFFSPVTLNCRFDACHLFELYGIIDLVGDKVFTILQHRHQFDIVKKNFISCWNFYWVMRKLWVFIINKQITHLYLLAIIDQRWFN